MSDAAIDITGVEKRYGRLFGKKVDALRGVSMRVDRGEVFGLLGPNGAGKSTLVKILMTVVRPTKCRGSVLGQRAGTVRSLARVGYLPEHPNFPRYLTGRQIVEYSGALSGMPRKRRRARVGELLELVGMSDWGGSKVGGYSKGMRQRVGIAQALVHDPELVLLDEPTDGVDPVGRRDIRDITKRLKDEGRTVFINSHLLSELEAVCDRVAIMVKGRVVQQGTIDELTEGQRGYEIELPATADLDLARSVVDAASPEPCTLDNARRTLVLPTEDAEVVQPAIDALRARRLVLRSVRPVRPSLEDLFMTAVTDPETGRPLAPGADRKPGQPNPGQPEGDT
ncbi:MAG: ABC transporter ATP-binding protein [Planctomycetota bacterium]